jgi:hypothetical protein
MLPGILGFVLWLVETKLGAVWLWFSYWVDEELFIGYILLPLIIFDDGELFYLFPIVFDLSMFFWAWISF